MTVTTHEVVVQRPVGEVYDEWTAGADLSRRLGDDIEVEPIADALTRWTVPVAGGQRQIVVREVRRTALRDIVWLSVSGPRLAGRLSFRPLTAGSTRVRLSVDFDPRNLLGWLAGSFGVPDRTAARVLERFQHGEAAPPRSPEPTSP